MILSSAKTLNKYMPIVVLIGVFDVRVFNEGMEFITIIGVLLSFVMTFLVLGHSAGVIVNSNNNSYLAIIKENGLNYVTVALALVAPIILMSILGINEPAFKELFKFAIGVVSIYVFPILFVPEKVKTTAFRRSDLSAILTVKSMRVVIHGVSVRQPYSL